jgi:glyceraldehyde-3-phosphate dehydrogenase (NAD(P))
LSCWLATSTVRCFTPQDGNSLLSSVAAAAWLLDPHTYDERLASLTPYLFKEV